ncbi:hypothetical protein [Erwinia tracheiphila]|uniref:hypothetical protein n=1 Tax=Erwinia tracheiphila TaxID=65700 RepID=UPI0012F7E592|nr:hypothetical protein [Erwinia tracheiphila]
MKRELPCQQDYFVVSSVWYGTPSSFAVSQPACRSRRMVSSTTAAARPIQAGSDSAPSDIAQGPVGTK